MACFTDHHILVQPKNPNIKVWKYLDLPKFISLLQERSLFFSLPSGFSDIYEGKLSNVNQKEWNNVLNSKSLIEKQLFALCQISKGESVYINCWHMNNYESEAMWKLYSDSKNAIAIQSTYQKLVDCIPEYYNKTKKIYAGIIKYIDYKTEKQEIEKDLDKYCYKRFAFQHENECRIIFDSEEKCRYRDVIINEQIHPQRVYPSSSCKIEIDLNLLVENIYISPNSDKWFMDLVKKLVKEQFCLEYSIKRSEL